MNNKSMIEDPSRAAIEALIGAVGDDTFITTVKCTEKPDKFSVLIISHDVAWKVRVNKRNFSFVTIQLEDETKPPQSFMLVRMNKGIYHLPLDPAIDPNIWMQEMPEPITCSLEKGDTVYIIDGELGMGMGVVQGTVEGISADREWLDVRVKEVLRTSLRNKTPDVGAVITTMRATMIKMDRHLPIAELEQ